jgi:FtsH-like protein
VLQRRAICATCGHTHEWHDRDEARSLLGVEPGIERPCYREVGGAPCRCGGFRDSGESAVPAGAARPPVASSTRLFQNAALTLLLVIMGLALLYAYRSQTPSIPTVSVTQAIQDVQAGRVRSVVIRGSDATLELANGTRERTTVPQPDDVFAKAILEYNAANPTQRIDLRYETEAQTLPVVGAVLLSLLPVFLIGGFFYYMMLRARDRR